MQQDGRFFETAANPLYQVFIQNISPLLSLLPNLKSEPYRSSKTFLEG